MGTELQLILRNQIAIMQALRCILTSMGETENNSAAYCSLMVARESTMDEIRLYEEGT